MAVLTGAVLSGGEIHDHRPAFEQRCFVHCAVFGAMFREFCEQFASDLKVRHLASAELYDHLDLVPIAEKLARVVALGVEVARIDVAGELYLLDLDDLLLLFGFLVLLVSLEPESAVIHHAADRRICLLCDKHQVESFVIRAVKRRRICDQTKLLAFGTHDAQDFRARNPKRTAYLLVDKIFLGIVAFDCKNTSIKTLYKLLIIENCRNHEKTECIQLSVRGKRAVFPDCCQGTDASLDINPRGRAPQGENGDRSALFAIIIAQARRFVNIKSKNRLI